VATFTTPCVVLAGVVGGRAVYLELDSGKRVEEFVGVDVDSAAPAVVGDFLEGHLAVTSYSATIVKGVALLKPAYVLDAEGLRPLVKKAVTVRSVKAKEFGSWEPLWNKPVFLQRSGPTVAVGFSRAGALLHINAVPSNVEIAEKALAVARILQRGGELHVNCTCRLGLMPVEIFVRRDGRYIVAKFYLNASSPRSSKAFFIAGEGGNVLERREVGLAEAEVVAYEFLSKLKA